jgi:hypothetical protein
MFRRGNDKQYRDLCGKCGARRIDNQIGLEPTPELHIEALLAVFREVKRVMRADACLWLNYGDCYACQKNGRPAAEVEGDDRTFRDKPFSTVTDVHRKNGQPRIAGPNRSPQINLKAKDLVMMPYRLAIALQADGWFVRSAITICKNNPLPESVTDRPTNATEMLFLLTKEPRYYFDATAVREPSSENPISAARRLRRDNGAVGTKALHGTDWGQSGNGVRNDEAGRNMRNYLILNAQPMKDAHYAAFSEKLVEPCILAGTSERGVCPECGAPWERVTEKGNLVPDEGSESGRLVDPVKRDSSLSAWSRPGGKVETVVPNHHRERIDRGWRRTCAHQHTEAELLPALVLDPFAGSGTVSRVASRLGRRSIGIELSEEYVEKIARKRTSQGSLGL